MISNAHELLDVIVTFLLPLPPIRLSGEGVSPVNICEYDVLCVSSRACGWGREVALRGRAEGMHKTSEGTPAQTRFILRFEVLNSLKGEPY